MDREPDGDLDELKFDAEELIAYELGVKSVWFDRSVVLNGAVFYQDYSDKQLPVQRNVGDFVSTAIDNVGSAEVLGLELEAIWQITDTVRTQLGYTYLDGEYTELGYQTNSANSIARAGNCTLDPTVVDPTLCAIKLNGNSLEDIPTHSLVALAGWYPALGVGYLNAILEADVEYQDRRFVDEFNDREVAAFSIVNLRAGVETDAWDVLVYVNNAFDNDTVQSWSPGLGLVATAERTNPNLFAFPAEGFSIAPAPRHWGVRLNIRY
jgi:iron complex outermembrane receptor protein